MKRPLLLWALSHAHKEEERERERVAPSTKGKAPLAQSQKNGGRALAAGGLPLPLPCQAQKVRFHAPSTNANAHAPSPASFRLKIATFIAVRRFDDATLGVLRTLLVSRDARSAVQVRSSLERFMRFESLCILRQIADKDAVHMLSVLEFLVRAFAVIGDVEVSSTNAPSSVIHE